MLSRRLSTLAAFSAKSRLSSTTNVALMGLRSQSARLFSTQQEPSNVEQVNDIVIIGGGPAGLTMALALKNSPLTQSMKISLIEGGDLDKIRSWSPPDNFYENRVVSLTPSSVKFLQSIGAWDEFSHDRIQSYDEMKVWDGLSDAQLEFNPAILGENTDIAYMVEVFNIQHSLLKRIDKLNESLGKNKLEIIQKSRVKSITQGENNESVGQSEWPIVHLDNGKSIKTRLLVGCDGANSPVRTFAGIESRGWDYNRQGLVATLKLEWEDFRNIAWQRFLPTGPIAMLPLPNGFASLVWSTTPELAEHLKSLSSKDFVAMVNAAFRLKDVDLRYMYTMKEGLTEELEWRRQHTIIENEDNSIPLMAVDVLDRSRASFPLKLKHADTYVSERVALVGDAAHTTHPLAGQGLNMGQADVKSLVNALETAVKRGSDIGSSLSLEPYFSERYLPNHLLLGVVDKLHKIYSWRSPVIVAGRSIGLNLVNKFDLVKKFLMSQASK
ncbi:ubiquinone biosynthesis monooxygenase COQ6 [Nadsonia fulvescens var. elongata DSM 6958]|uniref:Ubiquinone biosynthesis monooxygenase COQ6, mitochondrial n=1 Tax=Nadsonia fulvescens var. elongata DSM 6958 TaxID=857566 RepID=A0A1E3PM86_9ASCO|nr:ubiquinone biosynthesis monooxygenase COQ6 [Nadsonia fulvescens var. elongata DSM 6958]